MTLDLSFRLDDFARRLEALEHELAELRALARPAAPEPSILPPPLVPPAPVVAQPAAAPPAPRPAPLPTQPAREPREIDLSVLFGAKALAWA